jgi:hypothetical protein
MPEQTMEAGAGEPVLPPELLDYLTFLVHSSAIVQS